MDFKSPLEEVVFYTMLKYIQFARDLLKGKDIKIEPIPITFNLKGKTAGYFVAP